MGDAGLTRDDAWKLLNEYLKTPNLIKHCLATEAILRELALKFGADPDSWGIAGLVHDIDLDMVNADMSTHAEKGAQILRDAGLETELVEAVRRHNAEGLGLKRETELDYALAAGETITGLIIATALVYPDKKLSSVKPKSITKRFKSARFAAGANREIIMECEKIGIDLKEFVEISLKAMQGVAEDLGL